MFVCDFDCASITKEISWIDLSWHNSDNHSVHLQPRCLMWWAEKHLGINSTSNLEANWLQQRETMSGSSSCRPGTESWGFSGYRLAKTMSIVAELVHPFIIWLLIINRIQLGIFVSYVAILVVIWSLFTACCGEVYHAVLVSSPLTLSSSNICLMTRHFCTRSIKILQEWNSCQALLVTTLKRT